MDITTGQQPPNPELDEALIELQQYLSDSLAPLIVVDSVWLLMQYPPEIVATTIQAWTGAQYRQGSGGVAPVSDYLFHCMKKIHMMGEFNLIAREPLRAYLDALKAVVLGFCPAEDRETLRENLARLEETASASTVVSPAQTILRQGVSGPRGAAGPSAAKTGEGDSRAASDEALRGLRRFSLVMERLANQGALAGPAPAAAGALPAPPFSEALALAARSSHSGPELQQYLERLKASGVEASTDNLFRALAQTLPAWIVPVPVAAGAGGEPPVESRALGAMRRIVTDVEDPAEGGRRFQELVRAGIERFNEGSLAQAVQTLDLADRLVSEKKIDAGSAELVRRRLGETLSPERLKKFGEVPEQHASLRRVLDFFTDLTPDGLFADLQREPKRDRRRLLLLLLEVHGAPARVAAHEYLSRVPATAVGEEEWFFRRNLLYVLRRIPRTPEASFEDEPEIVLRHAQLGLPLVVVKEALAALALYRDERTEQGLIGLVAGLEAMLEKPDEAPYQSKDVRALLDRAAATLARLPTAKARRAIIDHAGRKSAALGDAMARLTELGSQDLSDDPDAVERLLALMKANMPFKLLGMTLRQNDQAMASVIEALSGTPSPAVRRALDEIASKFRGQELGKIASRVIAGFDRAAPAPEAAAPEASPANLQGDLEVFGLPALLQSLGDSSSSGLLTLRQPGSGEVFATIRLNEGKLQEIEMGKLKGEDAFYQILERPIPGQFAFVKGSPLPSGEPLREPLPLIFEAMRRYDELQEAIAFVPDESRLARTPTRATPPPDEKDGSLLQAIWERVTQGATALECEAAVASDSFRIRRALAHWVEEGALKIQSAGNAG
jgi:hypothetical protein